MEIIVTAKWVNWRVGLVLGVIAIILMAVSPSATVREVRNANLVSNFALVDPRPHDDDWPWFRGAEGRNVAASDRISTRWSLSDGEGWHIGFPGFRYSTPSIWGDQLFLTTIDSASQQIALKCYHRQTGRATWQTEIHHGGLPSNPGQGNFVASMPACDGQSVFTVATVNQELWLTSVDLSGRIVWQQQCGSYRSRWGYRSSPTIFKSLVIVAADQEQNGYLIAFHRQTGSVIWCTKRPNGDSVGSPIVATIAGRSQLILSGNGSVSSYNPATGDALWSYHWSGERVANSIAFDSDHVFATTKYPAEEVVCIKADGSGDITKTHLVWRQSKIGSDVPSPVQYGGRLYVLSDDGRLGCLDAATGTIEWQKRIEGRYSASPVIAGEYLICSNEAGLTTIFQRNGLGSTVAENSIAEGILASPVIAGDSIFLRTSTGIRRIGMTTSEPIAERPEPSKRRL